MRLLTFGHFIVHGSVEFGDPALPVNKVEQARRDDQKQGPLLRGLLIDSHGVAMSANSVAVGGGTVSRHYVSEKTQSSCIAPDRIPAVRLENSVVAVLHRMRLLNEEWSRDELATILRRVVVLEKAIVLQLDKRLCLAAWRAQEPALQRITTREVLRLVGACLTKNEEISEAGTALCLRLPRHARARRIRERAPKRALLFQ